MATVNLSYDIVATTAKAAASLDKLSSIVEKLSDKLDKIDGRRASATVEVNTGKADADLTAVGVKINALDGKKAKVGVDADKKSLTDTTNAFAMLAKNMAGLARPVAIGVALPSLVAVGQMAATASQSLLLLPAAGAAAATVMGTVHLATSGLGDAFKQVFAAKQNPEKLALMLDQLSPKAREFVLQVQTMTPALTALQHSVQDAAFDGMTAQLTTLSGKYLPLARTELTGVATALNAGAQGIGSFLGQASTVGQVTVMFANIRKTMDQLAPAGQAIVSIFLDMAGAGSAFLPGLAAGFTEGAQAAAAFVSRARESGQLATWISQGLSMLGILAQTLLNVGSIVASVFRAANTGGEGFAMQLRNITGQVAQWAQSMQGQQAIAGFFTNLRDLAAALWPLFEHLASSSANTFSTLVPNLPPLVKGLTDVLVAAAPLTGLFLQLAVQILPPLGSALSFLAPVLGPLVALMIGASVATKAWGVATAILEGVQVAFGAAQKIVNGAVMAYNLIAAIVRGNINLWATAQLLLNLAMEANPIGLIIVIIGVLVAAIILAWNHSETFRRVVMAAWEGIKTAAGAAWDFLKMVFAGIVSAAVAVGTGFMAAMSAIGTAFVTAWTGIRDFFVGLWQGVLGAVTAAWGAITSFLSATWAGIVNLATTVWNGIVSFFTTIWNFISTVATTVWNAITDYFRRLFEAHHELIMQVWNAITGFLTGIWNAISGFAQMIWGAITAFFQAEVTGWQIIFTTVWNAISSFATMIWTAISTFFTTIWTAVSNFFTTIWNGISAFAVAIWTAISAFFTGALNAFLAWWSGVWQAISAFFSVIWTAIQNTAITIWNAIVAFLQPAITAFQNFFTTVWNAISSFFSVVWTGIQTAATTIWNAISGFFTGAINAFSTWWSGVWNGISTTFSNIWNGIKSAAQSIWDGISAVFRGGVNAAIDAINWLTDKVNVVLKFLLIPTIAPIPKMEAGGTVAGAAAAANQGSSGQVRALAAGDALFSPIGGGFATNRPKAIVGEGRGNYPEYVIPTDPQYRGRALGLYEQLGTHLMADGGILGTIGGWVSGAASTVWNGVTSAASAVAGKISDVMQWVGGGVSGLISEIKGAVRSMLPAGLVGDMGGGIAGKLADGAASFIKKKYDEMQAALAAAGGGAGTVVANGPLQAMITATAAQFGWNNPAQIGAINWIIAHESGGRPTAQNPTSTAYGLFQFLNSTWATVGGTKTSDPALQILYGLRYIAQRYGTPVGAQAFWQAHGYYANGGIIDRPTFGLLGEAGPEVILPLNRPQRAESLARQAGVGQAGEGGFNLTVVTNGAADAERIISVAMHHARLRRSAGRYTTMGGR